MEHPDQSGHSSWALRQSPQVPHDQSGQGPDHISEHHILLSDTLSRPRCHVFKLDILLRFLIDMLQGG